MLNKNYINYQLIHLGISLYSSFSVLTNFYVYTCSNIVGLLCLIDCCFVKKKNMLLHHILVLFMIHYMNNHNSENRDEIISVILSTEISTIFLTANSLLDNTCNMILLKNINRFIFVSTFFYFRIYNYAYYIILDKNSHSTFLIQSKNIFELFEIYITVHGLFILNLYWFYLIIKKIFTYLPKSNA